MHVMSTAVLDPSTAPGRYDVVRVRELLLERMHLLPPFRRRLVTVPFDLHNPLWVEDPDFDLDYHVRRAALPSPGGPRELAEFTAEVASRPKGMMGDCGSCNDSPALMPPSSRSRRRPRTCTS